MRFVYTIGLLALLCAGADGSTRMATSSARIVVGGKTSWRVYLPAWSGHVESFARDELAKYVQLLSGARLPHGDRADGPRTIVLGLREDLASTSGLPKPKPGHDGYSIIVSSSRVVIAGENPRGLLYGVYDLLELLGCRWYFPALDKKDAEVIPHRPYLSLPAGRRSESARIEDRIYWISGLAFRVMPESLAQIDWAAKNRYNGLSWQCVPELMDQHLGEMQSRGVFAAMAKRGLMLHGPGHSFPYFLPTNKYFDKHPEWFGFRDGKRQPHGGNWPLTNFCMSSAEACEEFIRNVTDFAKKHPQIRRLDLLPIDGGLPCQCEECLRSTPTDLLIGLYNKLANRLEQVAPEVVVDCVPGYGQLEKPPTKVFPSSRLAGLYAHWGRNHAVSYDDAQYERRQNLIEWQSYFKRFMICSYYAANSHQPFNGPPFLHAIEGDTKFMVEHGVTGSLVLEYPFGFWWNNAFNVRLGGSYAYYYPKRDPKSELRDFAVNYYGPRAGPILARVYGMMGDNANLEHLYRASRGEADGPEMLWLKDLQAMIGRAARLAGSDPVYSYRVSKLDAVMDMLVHLGPSRNRIAEIEKEAAERDRNEAEIRRKIADARATTADLIARAQKLADMDAGLMDIEWFKGWMIGRTFTGALDEAEKTLRL